MFQGIADVVVSVFPPYILQSLAERLRIQVMDSPDRAHFLANLKTGGKYEGTIGLYRHNVSADHIGVFDQEIVNALAPNVKWIAHNGAGYDQIDVQACKEKGDVPFLVQEPRSDDVLQASLFPTLLVL